MFCKKIIVIIGVLFCAEPALSQKNEISILNDRFYFTFPDTAKNIARATNIMSAGRNANRETRVIYDIGEKRIVFFAQELFLKSVSNLENTLKSESGAAYHFVTKTIYNKDSVQCVKITPEKFDEKAAAILINTVIIKNADNTLSRFDTYLNPKAFADRATFDKISEQVLSSFRKGNRRINLNARVDSFFVLGSKNIMQISFPKDYMITVDNAGDFETYNIKKVVAYGDTLDASIIIYFGFHPSLFNGELQLTNFKTPDTDGEFMGQKMQWMNFNDSERKLLLREQVFADDDIGENAKIHIALIANDQKLIDELTLIVKNILLKYHK